MAITSQAGTGSLACSNKSRKVSFQVLESMNFSSELFSAVVGVPSES